jgi:hypothetical protein
MIDRTNNELRHRRLQKKGNDPGSRTALPRPPLTDSAGYVTTRLRRRDRLRPVVVHDPAVLRLELPDRHGDELDERPRRPPLTGVLLRRHGDLDGVIRGLAVAVRLVRAVHLDGPLLDTIGRQVSRLVPLDPCRACQEHHAAERVVEVDPEHPVTCGHLVHPFLGYLGIP